MFNDRFDDFNEVFRGFAKMRIVFTRDEIYAAFVQGVSAQELALGNDELCAEYDVILDEEIAYYSSLPAGRRKQLGVDVENA